MNKKILLGLPLGGIALVSAAYVGTAWYAGKQLDTHMQAGITELARSNPMVQISDIKVERGIFRTQHEMTFAFNPDCIDTGIAPKKPEMQAQLDKMKVRLRHTIMHGPLSFANGIQPALAAFQGQLVFDQATTQELKKVLGDQPVLAWHGVLQFDRKHQFKLHSPAFELDKKGAKISWAGIQGEGSGNLHDLSYQLKLHAPKLAVSALAAAPGASGDALVENMHMVAEGSPGASKVGIGTASFGIDRIQFTDTRKNERAELSKLAVLADVKESGEFIDMQIAYKIGSLVAGAEQKKFGPAVLEIGFEHIHAPSLVALNQSMNRIMCAKPEQKQAMTMEVMQQWKQLASTMLQNKPVFQLKQVKFTAPDGELNFKGKISVDGFQPAMIDDLQAAMTALPGVVHIELSGNAPEKLLMSSFREFTVNRSKHQMMLTGAGALPPEQLQALQESAEQGARQQLGLAIAQNFIKQEGEQLSFNFSFSKGQASLNGVALDLPFLPQTAAAPMAENPATLTAAPAASQ